jgi:hypothetical protein
MEDQAIFAGMIWLLPTPFPSLELIGGGGGDRVVEGGVVEDGGAESFEQGKNWFSINHSILSGNKHGHSLIVKYALHTKRETLHMGC